MHTDPGLSCVIFGVLLPTKRRKVSSAMLVVGNYFLHETPKYPKVAHYYWSPAIVLAMEYCADKYHIVWTITVWSICIGTLWYWYNQYWERTFGSFDAISPVEFLNITPQRHGSAKQVWLKNIWRNGTLNHEGVTAIFHSRQRIVRIVCLSQCVPHKILTDVGNSV